MGFIILMERQTNKQTHTDIHRTELNWTELHLACPQNAHMNSTSTAMAGIIGDIFTQKIFLTKVTSLVGSREWRYFSTQSFSCCRGWINHSLGFQLPQILEGTCFGFEQLCSLRLGCGDSKPLQWGWLSYSLYSAEKPILGFVEIIG